MSESPEREVETGVANGENSHEDDRKEDVDDMDRDGAHIDDDEEEEKAEKVDKDVERSPSPRARSTSPVREATPDSRSRSPVQRARSDSRDRARSDSRENRRRRSRSGSRDNRRARYSRSRSRDRDYRRRSRSRDRGDRYRSRRSPSPRRDRYRSSRYSPERRGGGRRSPVAPYYNRPRRTPPRHGTTLFVAGLNFVTTEREVESKFDKFGPVREARIVRNPVNGESRGFGFVAMKHEEDVDAAIRALDGAEWQGRRLGVERARNVK